MMPTCGFFPKGLLIETLLALCYENLRTRGPCHSGTQQMMQWGTGLSKLRGGSFLAGVCLRMWLKLSLMP